MGAVNFGCTSITFSVDSVLNSGDSCWGTLSVSYSGRALVTGTTTTNTDGSACGTGSSGGITGDGIGGFGSLNCSSGLDSAHDINKTGSRNLLGVDAVGITVVATLYGAVGKDSLDYVLVVTGKFCGVFVFSDN